MAFIPVAKTVEAEIRMLLDGQKVENTLYFRYLTVPTPANLDALGAALLDWWETSYATLVTPETTVREIYLTSLDTETSPAATVVPAAPLAGTIESSILPNNASFCVSFRTASRGRSFRGRNYIAGLAASGVVNNTLEEAYVTNIVNAYTALLTVAFGLSNIWSVVSRFSGNAPRVAGVTTNITTVVAVDRTVDSMRRRLPSRGT